MIGLTLVVMMSILGAVGEGEHRQGHRAARLTSQLVVSNAIGSAFSPDIAERDPPGRRGRRRSRSSVRPSAKVDGDASVRCGAADPTAARQGAQHADRRGAGRRCADGPCRSTRTRRRKRHGSRSATRSRWSFRTTRQKLDGGGHLPANSMPATYLGHPGHPGEGRHQAAGLLLFITTAAGCQRSRGAGRDRQGARRLPTVTLKNQQEFVDEQLAQINMFLYIIYALLGAGHHHRDPRHHQHLGALGDRADPRGRAAARGRAEPAAARRMVRLESVAIALLGAVLGRR